MPRLIRVLRVPVHKPLKVDPRPDGGQHYGRRNPSRPPLAVDLDVHRTHWLGQIFPCGVRHVEHLVAVRGWREILRDLDPVELDKRRSGVAQQARWTQGVLGGAGQMRLEGTSWLGRSSERRGAPPDQTRDRRQERAAADMWVP